MTFDDLCHVCDIDYDHIAKVETISVDAEWLLPTLFPGHASLSMSWKHSADSGGVPTLNSGSNLRQFWRGIAYCFHRRLSVCLSENRIKNEKSTVIDGLS